MRAAIALLCASCTLLVGCAAQLSEIDMPQERAKAISLVPQFNNVAQRILELPEEQRFAAYERDVVPLLPGIYKPGEKSTPEKYRAHILKQLAEYPAQRDRILAVSASFEKQMATADARFRHFFPDYELTMPTYLIHSFGQMDGGTRELDGKTNLIFGADVIAKIHDENTIGPLFDHELFHAYHNEYFDHCDQLWCSLWSEGLAVYVTAQMNPGITTKGLLLDYPRPIAPEVDMRLKEAAQAVRAVFDSEEGDDYAPLFFASQGYKPGDFPPRYGYYVGYLAVKKMATKKTIRQLAKMRPAEVRPLLEQALADLGGIERVPASRER